MVRKLLLLPLLYLCWLGMMAVHELGHISNALLSGGRISRVSLPLVGFSQTFFRFNPHPLFVVWGGTGWGSVLPVVGWLAIPRRWKRARAVAQFFAGFCLIANGAYLGVGWVRHAGDAGDLMWYGTPVWVLIAVGATAMTAGLYLWHLLGLPEQVPATNNSID
jgi:hypothetical protein